MQNEKSTSEAVEIYCQWFKYNKISYFPRIYASENIPLSYEDSDNEQSEAHESCESERNSQKNGRKLAFSAESVSD